MPGTTHLRSRYRPRPRSALPAMRSTLINASVPHPSTVFDLVFANPPDALLRERDEFVEALEPGGAE